MRKSGRQTDNVGLFCYTRYAFRANYSYVATASEQQLSQALAQVIGALDPMLIEALT